MKTSIKELANLIYTSNGAVDLYILHVNYRLTPSDIAFAARFFNRIGLGDFEGDLFTPSCNSKAWLHSKRQRFFLDPRRPWASASRTIPDPGKPYLPDLKRVDKAFFKNKIAPTRPKL